MFPKIVVPQIIHFNRVFHYKPSILGYPYFWKHPFGFSTLFFCRKKTPKKSEGSTGSAAVRLEVFRDELSPAKSDEPSASFLKTAWIGRWVLPKIGGKPPKWMSCNGNPYSIGWFGDTTIFGNTQMNETFDLTAKDHLKTASWKTVDYHRFPHYHGNLALGPTQCHLFSKK